ncbi:8286_t:CDS:2 [Rhizophagus irregularis]|nr:8286_t:CDS:2 [Rhizophagus irregularis]
MKPIPFILSKNKDIRDAGTLKRTCLLKRWVETKNESIELVESHKI